MAFTPEDGTGLAAANSLATLDYADAYFEERGVTAWTGTDTVKEQALVRATDYMESRWGKRGRFRGQVQFPDTPQALSFPRLYIGHDGAVPDDIKRAVCEYALRTLDGTALAPDPTTTVGAQVELVRKKVGPLETETRYANGGNPSAVVLKPYPAADMLVKPYLLGSGLVRA